ncbi:MAG: O-antigen ligase family protein [Chloroflexi bacterium]|nr:O-antigen ligase family protein [Chloroflexota bacterium]
MVRQLAGRLAAFEIWVVGASLLLSILSQRLLLPAVALIALFWLLRAVASSTLLPRTPADWGVLLLLCLLPLNRWLTPLPDTTAPQILRLLSGMGVFYALVAWANQPRRIVLAVAALSGGILLISAVGLLSADWISTKFTMIPAAAYALLPRLPGDVIHPNILAGSLALLTPLPLGTLLYAWRKLSIPSRVALILVVVLAVALLFFTQSRGGIAAFSLAAACLFLSRLSPRPWVWIVALTAGALAANLIFRASPLALAAMNDTASLDIRLEIWSRALYMIQDYPFTGAGMGVYGPLADALYPFLINAPGSVPHAHNLFLQITADLGLPGLVAWLSVFFAIQAATWKAYHRLRGEPLAAGILAGLLAANLAMVAHGLVESALWGMVRPAPLVWALWGLAITVHNAYAAASPGA